MDIYNKLPVWGQNLACCYEGNRIKRTRYGKDFQKYLVEYRNRANWNYEQLCEYRNQKLYKMVQHAYKTVPYYKKVFNERGLDPKKIRTLDDLKLLPILTKATIKENPSMFISSEYNIYHLVKCYTGGTTGSGFLFYKEAKNISEQWALWWKYRNELGIKYGTMCGNFGGKLVVPSNCTKGPYWRENYPCMQIIFDEYHLNRETMLSYIDAIKKYDIHWIHGYASNISRLASWMNEKGLVCLMNYVTTGGDNLYDYQKKQIKDAFGVWPFQHYGASEGVANFSQDKNGIIRIDEDFSAVEIISSSNGDNKIVGTTLSNYAMPFLRYDTGDLVGNVKIPDNLEKGGRVVESIYGREACCIPLKNGGVLGEPAFSLIFEYIPNIVAAQIVQTKEDILIFNVIRNKYYNNMDEKKLCYEIRSRLGDREKFKVNYVEELKRTKSGKIVPMIKE